MQRRVKDHLQAAEVTHSSSLHVVVDLRPPVAKYRWVLSTTVCEGRAKHVKLSQGKVAQRKRRATAKIRDALTWAQRRRRRRRLSKRARARTDAPSGKESRKRRREGALAHELHVVKHRAFYRRDSPNRSGLRGRVATEGLSNPPQAPERALPLHAIQLTPPEGE